MITQGHAEASAAVPSSAMSSSRTGSVAHVFDTRPVPRPLRRSLAPTADGRHRGDGGRNGHVRRSRRTCRRAIGTESLPAAAVRTGLHGVPALTASRARLRCERGTARGGLGHGRSAHAGDRRRGNRAQGRRCSTPTGEMISERVRASRRRTRARRRCCSTSWTSSRRPSREYDRVSVGFPGAIRRGRVREVPAFSRRGPGEPNRTPSSSRRGTASSSKTPWQQRFGRPTRVANDADVQGCAVVTGTRHGAGDHPRDRRGLRGVLRRHAAAAHGALPRPLRRGPVDRGRVRRPPAARRSASKAWRKLVLNALDAFEAMVLPDHIFIGGGNAKRLDPDTLGPNRTRRAEHLRAARRHQALGTRRRGRGDRRGPHAREVLASAAHLPASLAEG